MDAEHARLENPQPVMEAGHVPLGGTEGVIEAGHVPLGGTEGVIEAGRVPLGGTEGVIDAGHAPLGSTKAAEAGPAPPARTEALIGADDLPLAASNALPVSNTAPDPSQRGRLQLTWLLAVGSASRQRLLVDLLMLVLAMLATLSLARAAELPLGKAEVLLAYPVLAIGVLYVRGAYRSRIGVGILDPLGKVLSACSVAAMMAVALVAVNSTTARPGPMVALAWLFAVVMVSAGRVIVALFERRARIRGSAGKPTLIIGAGIVGTRVARRLLERPEYGLRPVGFLDSDPGRHLAVAGPRPPVLGIPADLEHVAARTGTEHVMLAFPGGPDRGLLPVVRECEKLGLEVSLVPRLFESINNRLTVEHLGGLPLLELRPIDPKGVQFMVKHTFDRAAAALALTVLSPLLVATALAVKLTSPGPVLFRQLRVGRDGKAFMMLKFRSMHAESEAIDGFWPETGFAPGGVEGTDRRTAIGRFLRRASIDELPQLWNVLRGDMSIVGPRPERPEFVELFSRDFYRYSDRQRVRSGITGWAQVHGLRGQTSLEDRIEWDNYYIENWSLGLDLKTLLLTCRAIFQPQTDA